MNRADRALTLENRLAAYYIAVGLLALGIGGLMGVLQALQHSGINLYPYLYPVLASYYHGLTYHGVMMVLVWTTFFISGFLTFVAAHSLGRPLASPGLGKFTFGLMLAGLLLAAWPIATNDATVLFTFYPPMQAHPAFYIGLTLVVVGTWLILLNLVLTYRQWRAENPGVRTPLPAFMALVTLTMWFIASLGVALEMVAILIPFAQAAHGHQLANARALAATGAAWVMEERQASPSALASLLTSVFAELPALAEKGAQAKGLARPDATEEVVRVLVRLSRKPVEVAA